jgi:hypothetical protein
MIANGWRCPRKYPQSLILQRWKHLLFDEARESAARWYAASGANRRAIVLARMDEKKARGAAQRILRALGPERYAM